MPRFSLGLLALSLLTLPGCTVHLVSGPGDPTMTREHTHVVYRERTVVRNGRAVPAPAPQRLATQPVVTPVERARFDERAPVAVAPRPAPAKAAPPPYDSRAGVPIRAPAKPAPGTPPKPRVAGGGTPVERFERADPEGKPRPKNAEVESRSVKSPRDL